MSAIISEFVEGDLLPFVSVEWEDHDMTGYSAVLRVQKPSGECFERLAIFDNAAEGKFHFEWQAGDLVAGESKAEIEITDTMARNETWSGIILRVGKSLG
jgi:hypothetical protein